MRVLPVSRTGSPAAAAAAISIGLLACLWLLGGSYALAAGDDSPPPPVAEDAQPAAKPVVPDPSPAPATPPAAPAKAPAKTTLPDPKDAATATATDQKVPETATATEKKDAATPTPPDKKPAETAPAPETKAAAVTAPEKTATAPKKKAPAKAAPKAHPKKQLTAAQVELRDRIRRTMASQYQQPFNTRDNTAADLIKYCWAFGCQSEIERAETPGQKVNAITCLCWDLPCGGYHVLALDGGHIAARIGYGLQDDPAELLAMLAMAYVPSDYPLRAGQTTRTVADLVESEKLSCRSGTEMSLRLIGLSHYVEQATWKNSLDETWSIEQMVAEELSLPPLAGPRGITRLLGLSCALDRPGAKSKQPLEGALARAKTFVEDYQGYVLRTQSGDGGWSFRPAGGQASDRDYAVQFLTTGQIAEWLALSLPAQKLEEPSVVRAVEYLDTVLNSDRYRWNVQALSGRDIAAVAHAAHALVAYDTRVFKPADPEPAPEQKSVKPVVTAEGGQTPATVTQ